jgi:hypothetical protein
MGIVDSAVRCDILLEAWNVCLKADAEAAENEARAIKGLPPLSKLRGPRRPPADTIQIAVAGQKRTVALPPPGAFYDAQGNLVKPDNGVRRF